MELYLDKVYLEKIMIMGRWASSAVLWYIRIQVSDINKGISTLMTNNHAFYTIPEIEFVYHTHGQPDRMEWVPTYLCEKSSLSLPNESVPALS